MKHFQKLLVVWHNFIGRAGEEFEYIWINGSEHFIYLKLRALRRVKRMEREMHEFGRRKPPAIFVNIN